MQSINAHSTTAAPEVNADGHALCTNFQTPFATPTKEVPGWILGVVTVLMTNWQIMFWQAIR